MPQKFPMYGTYMNTMEHLYIHWKFCVVLLPEVSSTYSICLFIEQYYEVRAKKLLKYAQINTQGVYGIVLSEVYIIELRECPGLLTMRKTQQINGICTNQNSPLEIGHLYLTYKDIAFGKYYFDCHLLDGSTITRELLVGKFLILFMCSCVHI